ncbi:MAG: ribosome maturation factor RimP [Nocardioides sp.]
MSAADSLTSRIQNEVTAPLLTLGLDLEAVELTPAGKRRVLRIAVDQDGGVSMDDVAAATQEVNRVLDEGDLMGQQPYTLEVTSRGVDRPLTLPRHWRRNVDRLVKVTLLDGSSMTGRIGDCGDESASIEVSGVDKLLSYEDVARALVQIEFNRRTSGPAREELEDADDADDDTVDGDDDDTTEHD